MLRLEDLQAPASQLDNAGLLPAFQGAGDDFAGASQVVCNLLVCCQDPFRRGSRVLEQEAGEPGVHADESRFLESGKHTCHALAEHAEDVFAPVCVAIDPILERGTGDQTACRGCFDDGGGWEAGTSEDAGGA